MRDFTLNTYHLLLNSLLQQHYSFQTFEQFIDNPASRVVILRHDVDLKPLNSLATAQIENELNIKGSYYFRIVPESFDEVIIKRIQDFEHEIGYHYEDMDIAKGVANKAIEHFETSLIKLRSVATISTACMHGSPRSKFDNRNLWKSFNYRDFGIKGEPYFDIDFSKVFYITDTGRCWDGEKFSIRDKVKSPLNFNIHSTFDFIKHINHDLLPNQIMITIHPQRWDDNVFPWVKELVFQNGKNMVKRYVVNRK